MINLKIHKQYSGDELKARHKGDLMDNQVCKDKCLNDDGILQHFQLI